MDIAMGYRRNHDKAHHSNVTRHQTDSNVFQDDDVVTFADIFQDVSEDDSRIAIVNEVIPDAAQLKREREAARELRDSQWWKNELAKGICHYCGKKFKPSELTMDHIVPVSRGGRSVRSNVAVCCKDCNNRKKYLLPSEMAAAQIQPNGQNANENNV